MSVKTKEEEVSKIWTEIVSMTAMIEEDANSKVETGKPNPETVRVAKQEILGSGGDVWSKLEAELNNLLETANGRPMGCDQDDQPGCSGVADVESMTMVKPEPVDQKPTVILPETSSVSTVNGIGICDGVGISLSASGADVSYIPAIKNESGDIMIKTETMPEAVAQLQAGMVSEINGTHYMLVEDFPSLKTQEIGVKLECLPQFENSSDRTLLVPQETTVKDIKPSVEKLQKALGEAYLKKKKDAERTQLANNSDSGDNMGSSQADSRQKSLRSRREVANSAKVPGGMSESVEETRRAGKGVGDERSVGGRGSKPGQKECTSDAEVVQEERLRKDKAVEKPRYLVNREEGGFNDLSDDNDADVRMSDLTLPESDSEIEEIEDNTKRDLKVEDYFQDSDFQATNSSSEDSDLGCPDLKNDSVPVLDPVAVMKPIRSDRLIKQERPQTSEDSTGSSDDESEDDAWWGNELSSTKRTTCRIKRVNRGKKHQPLTKKIRKDMATVEIVEEEIVTANVDGSKTYNCPFCVLNLPYRTANNFMSHVDTKHIEINSEYKEKRDKLLAILFPLNNKNGRGQAADRQNVKKEQVRIEDLKTSDFTQLNDQGDKQYTCKFCKYTVPYHSLNTLMTHLHKMHKELTPYLKRQISDMLFDVPQSQAVQTPPVPDAVMSAPSPVSTSGARSTGSKSKHKKKEKGESSESVNLLPGAKRETLIRNGDGVYEFQCQFCPIQIKYKQANSLMSHIQAKHKNIVQNKATMALVKKDLYDNPNLEMGLLCTRVNIKREERTPLLAAPIKKPIQAKPVIEIGKNGKKMYRCKYCLISLVYHSPNVLMTHLGKKHQDIQDTPEHTHLLKYIYNGEFHGDDFETFCKNEDRKAGKVASESTDGKERKKERKRKVDSDDDSDDTDKRMVKERHKEMKKETREECWERDRKDDSGMGSSKKGKASTNAKHFVKKSSSGKDARKEYSSGGKDGKRDSSSGGKDGKRDRSSGDKDWRRDSSSGGKDGKRDRSSGGKDGKRDSSSGGKNRKRDSDDLRQQKDKVTENGHVKKNVEAQCKECGKVFTDGKLFKAHILTHF
ncbi:uncharacterized protein LOC135499830 [Lineus longissimus]|uniref:uncharacterized protein LOC135499830 n=1 Tax=Lineus longissimus TaxID=88925 RepID=UPI002B4D04AF